MTDILSLTSVSSKAGLNQNSKWPNDMEVLAIAILYLKVYIFFFLSFFLIAVPSLYLATVRLFKLRILRKKELRIL